MAYLDLNKLDETFQSAPENVTDGISYAHSAIQFAALALNARSKKWGFTEVHLLALAIELSFKSLALRSGATLVECRSAGHDPSKMISLIEKYGTTVPPRIKGRLFSKRWFKAFLLMSRYPAHSELNNSLDTTIFLHSDYPEMISEILEADCKWPLSFDQGGAMEMIKNPPKRMPYMKSVGTPIKTET